MFIFLQSYYILELLGLWYQYPPLSHSNIYIYIYIYIRTVPSGTPVRFRGGGPGFLGLCILLTCLMVVCMMMICQQRTLSLESPGGTPYLFPALRAHASPRAYSFLELQFVTLNFASILGSILDLILDQNSLIFQRLFALILKHRFLYDFEGIFVICL